MFHLPFSSFARSWAIPGLLTAASLVGCMASTTPPPTFDASLPNGTLLDSLDAAASASLCAQIVAFHVADDAASGVESTCLLSGSSGTEAECNAAVASCVSRGLRYTCDSTRGIPSAEPICAGVTVGDLEAGVALFAAFDPPYTQREWCALTPAARFAASDLSMSEARALAGFNCLVNSSVNPRAALNP